MSSMQPGSVSAELIRKTVQETLMGLGFTISEPNDIQADLHYLRNMRKGSEDIRKVVRHSLLTIMVSTGLYVLWEAVKHLLANTRNL